MIEGIEFLIPCNPYQQWLATFYMNNKEETTFGD